jgi:hypothetical protein
MLFRHMVPSWHEIQDRITRETGYQGSTLFRTHYNELVPSLSLNLRRMDSVRSAFDLAERMAAHQLAQRFSDIDISSVLDDLLEAVTQLAMIVAGSALTGGVIGAVAGGFFGGIGAVPASVAGAAMGLQLSTWILGVLGLASIAEFFVEGFPPICGYYLRGIEIAWEGPRGEQGLDAFSRDDPFAKESAAFQIALGHVEVVVLLFGAIVAYLTRGRGNSSVLAQQMQASTKGARLGQWMVKHEDALKKRRDLQTAEPRRGVFGPRDPGQPPKQPTKDHETSKGKPNAMAQHEVECFKADKMPASKIGEFDRQLRGQEDGLNRLTVQEYLDNVASPLQRSAKAAKEARKALEASLRSRFLVNYRHLGLREASNAATLQAKRAMSDLAGLHNPDLSAGGKDIIADFGDRQVNSSIGPQWRPKIANLKTAAEQVPKSIRESTFINVKLHRC